MQFSLDSGSLKPFTRALTCLSKYGDDLSIYATPESLSLSTTNSSMSAYCRFKYDPQFFITYKVGDRRVGRDIPDDVEEVEGVTGQLLAKSLLSILRHRAVDKSVDKCEMSIVEGSSVREKDGDEDSDGLESKLIVRMHCKHGVVKTHRLLLLTSTPASLMTPSAPDVPQESRLTIGPRAVRDIIEHFPSTKGPKSDPQLVWQFGDSDVTVKSLDTSIDTRGKGQLSTELTISADEFDVYEVQTLPITIAFHLREFNATVAFAESTSASASLDLRFTDPAAPLFIDVDGESASCEVMCVISTSQVPGASSMSSQPMSASANRKRERTEEQEAGSRIKKPMKVVQRASPGSARRAESNARSMPPPSLRFQSSPPIADRDDEPLFLPASQASQQVDEALGMEVSAMDADELAAMLEGEGEEVGYGSQRPARWAQIVRDGIWIWRLVEKRV
ncbi:hypothetical protein PLICRDRAFT_51091 [Plicaturopsis crispa FD-325 SS-3]|nr:hypothetical protein PLICRDRAFT_51091 [Plicaturopsis crispa FD-325 SS-3]